jgi:hypothetical protein
MPKISNEGLRKADSLLKAIKGAVSAAAGATARIESDQREIKVRLEKLERESLR